MSKIPSEMNAHWSLGDTRPDANNYNSKMNKPIKTNKTTLLKSYCEPTAQDTL